MASPTNTALLFPGQGSHEPAMGELVYEVRPDLAALACDFTGLDPFERAGESTRFAQPAIYAASIAAWEKLGEPAAALVAGHSLGELAALAVAGALDHADGLRLAADRGRLMAQAADTNPGGMLALMGDPVAARELASDHGLVLANENSPEQLVAAGDSDAIEEARRAARGAGLRAIALPVKGAFHTETMSPAAAAFAEILARVDFRPPVSVVLSCATARPFVEPRRELAEAIVSPVHWRQTMAELRERGVTEFIEPGPGQVLTKLVDRNPAQAEAIGA